MEPPEGHMYTWYTKILYLLGDGLEIVYANVQNRDLRLLIERVNIRKSGTMKLCAVRLFEDSDDEGYRIDQINSALVCLKIQGYYLKATVATAVC